MTNCIVRDGVILRLYGEVYPLPTRHGAPLVALLACPDYHYYHEPEPVAVAVVAATPVEEVSATRGRAGGAELGNQTLELLSCYGQPSRQGRRNC